MDVEVYQYLMSRSPVASGGRDFLFCNAITSKL